MRIPVCAKEFSLLGIGQMLLLLRFSAVLDHRRCIVSPSSVATAIEAEEKLALLTCILKLMEKPNENMCMVKIRLFRAYLLDYVRPALPWPGRPLLQKRTLPVGRWVITAVIIINYPHVVLTMNESQHVSSCCTKKEILFRSNQEWYYL